MCGIAGLITPTPRPLARVIQAMTDLVRHRGPDGEGYFVAGPAPALLAGADTPRTVFDADLPYAPSGMISANETPAVLALGHRRLAIVDLGPTGHQPMTTQDGHHVVVYNGEIYNYRELRSELERLGHVFRSSGDTEVLLNAYRQWGERCLERFNGMFAFLLYDTAEGKLFAARDRFGVKPFYFWRAPGGMLAFASEIKQFSAVPGWRALLNAQRAYDFLEFSITDHTDETLFSGVRQLRGGEFIHATLAELAHHVPVRTWYRLATGAIELPFDEASARFRDLLSDAVALRLRADVPVGTCLSGGLDSSTIVCLANARLREAGAHQLQNAFSVRSHIEHCDERPFIEEVVGHTDVKAHETFPDPDALLADLDRITWHHDEPFAGTSVFAEWCVFQLVATTAVKVTLDGHGADELLAGYLTFFGPHLSKLLLDGRLLALGSELRAGRRRRGHRLRHAVASMLAPLVPATVRRSVRKAIGRSATDARWMDTAALGVECYDFADRFAGPTRSVDALSRAQLLRTSLPLQLHWTDRNSMAHGIESRIPFLDYRVVEFVLGCPDDYKLRHGETKRILRAGMKGVLPEKVRRRQDKMGFVTAEAHWMTVASQARFLDSIHRAYEQSAGVFKPSALDEARKVILGEQRFHGLAWRMISFGAWMERFQVQARA